MGARMRINALMALLTTSVLTALPLGSATALQSSLAPRGFPQCGEIQQPKVLTGIATPDGAQFTWESKGPGAQFEIFINRYANGTWVKDDGWGFAGGALGTFVPWMENGVSADGVSLQVIQSCYGQAWGVPFTVWKSAIPKPSPTPTVTVTESAKPSAPRKIECVNRKTSEVKVFALKKCPTGWKRFT